MSSSTNMNIDDIISNLSQKHYLFGEGELSPSEIKQVKKQAKDLRGTYGVAAPIGKNIFSMISQNDDIIFQLQDFKDSDVDAMIIKYSKDSIRKYIVINSEKPLINQIFAAAHEFYHYQFSFNGTTRDSFVCSFDKNDKEEIKANRFAAEFLLPEEALKTELEGFQKFQTKYDEQPVVNQIVFCFSLVFKYALPLKAVLYRLQEENIFSTDFLLEHYSEVKEILLDFVKEHESLKELYSKKNNYINEQLYNLVPCLYNKGRLDDSTVDSIIDTFDLSESQIKGGLIKDE